jgi:hypothetical protein
MYTIYTIYTIYTNKFTYIHRYAYTCMHLHIYYRYSFECRLFFGGAYLLEDGLAPCGGEGWAPPHARAQTSVFHSSNAVRLLE